MKNRWHRIPIAFVVAAALLVVFPATTPAKKKSDRKKNADPYAEFVWPAPPDSPRIKLEQIISGRADVEAPSRFKRALLGASPQSAYDRLSKPFAVAFDPEGRILVTDSGNAALIRFDRAGERMDVLGTRGKVRLKLPLGLHVTEQGTIYVADAGLKQVVAFDPEGKVVAVFGRKGGLENPTDSALTPDGKFLFVADSRAHRIVVFEVKTADLVRSFGVRGENEGQFAWPTSLVFGPEGNLYVVDQINSRVQVFDGEGEFVDQFGSLGTGYANFARPKDVAVDEVGFIYVTDNAFNNVQIFDADFSLLTFVGEGGKGPGRFLGASGVAVRGDEFALVDQLGTRVQVFRYIVPRDQ